MINLDNHHCETGMSHPVYDAQRIYLCRVCSECEEAKLSRYRPEILTGYDQSDVNEPIEAEDQMETPFVKELSILVNTLTDRVLDIQKEFSILRAEHDRFFKNELLNIRNDISDIKRNIRKKR